MQTGDDVLAEEYRFRSRPADGSPAADDRGGGSGQLGALGRPDSDASAPTIDCVRPVRSIPEPEDDDGSPGPCTRLRDLAGRLRSAPVHPLAPDERSRYYDADRGDRGDRGRCSTWNAAPAHWSAAVVAD